MKKHFTKFLGVVALFTSVSLLTEAQTITAPVGTPITITNSIDVTGDINIGTANSLKLGGIKFLSGTASDVFMGLNTGTSATGGNNTFIGNNTGTNTTTGTANFFLGYSAGFDNTTGTSNVFMGVNAGRRNTVASSNVFIGNNAGLNNLSGNENIAIGANAGGAFSTNSDNVFLGVASGPSVTSSQNTMVGKASGYSTTTGSGNVYLGFAAGFSNTTGSNNTYIGNGAGYFGTTATLSNVTAIGAGAVAILSNTVVLGNAATTIIGAGLGSGSGLRFANITNGSPETVGSGTNGKVLSVDNLGNVILVKILSTTPGGTNPTTSSIGSPVAESWKESDGYLYNNSTNGVVIKGTGLDGNSLIVKGGVLSKEVNVKVEGSESWPDYVFKPNYKRMTLGEVEKFISINGHLPNIPSATEMAATGNNLGKTDVKLLEKVEELTLYLLEMKKANDTQAVELKALKQQVSKLRKK